MISCIAAVNNDYGIGKNGNLLFHLKEDMERFKELTTGKTVIMGRKTLDSLPGGKPLPNRNNIVITHNIDLLKSNPDLYSESAELALGKAILNRKDIFIIGGESIYKQLLRYCDKVYLTEVHVDCDADTYFPSLRSEFLLDSKSEVKQENNISYVFKTYIRVDS